MSRVPLPRDAVIDRMMLAINGVQNTDPQRSGYLSRDRAAHTIDMFKAAFGNPMRPPENAMTKSVSVATGLTYYDLRAPALNLFPTVSPLRNSVPRMQRANPGDAAHWKA